MSLLLAAIFLPLAAGPGLASGGVTFEDIAANDESGLTYQRVRSPNEAIFDEVRQQEVVTMKDILMTPIKSRGAPGVAIFDFDGDGDLDIYVTNGPGAANSLFSSQLMETGELVFVDVAVEAGVDATDHDSTGVCYGDINNNGYHDLLVLGTGEPNRLFLNRGDGAFVDITESSGVGGGAFHSAACAMGDVNGDGLLDIVVANTFDWSDKVPILLEPFLLNEHNQLFLNNGNNTFSDVSASSGIQDLSGLPPGAEGAASITWAIAMVDYDLDGYIDIIWAEDQGGIPIARDGGVDRGFTRIFKNDGAGHFTDVTEEVGMLIPGAYMGLAFADFNSDGHMDIFVTNVGDWFHAFLGVPYILGDMPSAWFLGQADATFTAPGVGDLIATPFGWGAAAVDYDNDGHTDIVFYGGLDAGPFVESGNPGVVLRNDGAGNFTYDATALADSADHTRRNVQGVAGGDLSGNGFVDIVTVSNFDIPEPIPLAPYPFSYGSPFEDPALFVPTFLPTEKPGEFVWSGIEFPDGTLAVEINSGNNINSGVEVRTLGMVGLTTEGRVNRDGVGAVVMFTPQDGQTAMQPIVAGSSYGSQDSLAANFGLRTAVQGTVEVFWPGGVRNRLYNVRRFEQVLFPEIPCSFAGEWSSVEEYQTCVEDALDELVDVGVLNQMQRGRFLSSALRAFNEL